MLKTSPSLSAASVGAVATKLGGEVCPVNGNTAHMSRHSDPIGVLSSYDVTTQNPRWWPKTGSSTDRRFNDAVR